jgi:glycosyltransferase involved in cell wall biosynthesis
LKFFSNIFIVKIIAFLIVVLSILEYNRISLVSFLKLNNNSNNNLNSSFICKIIYKINIATYTQYLENGGRARITSFLFNYLQNMKIFSLYLFTNKIKTANEYLIHKNIKRILIKECTVNNLIKIILKKRINIFINQFSQINKINYLEKLKNIRIINYQHQSAFFWIYSNYTSFKSLYKSYKNSKYIISLIHIENDYLFEKWGIKSIFMNNFITYAYNSTIPINYLSRTISMIGRASDKSKRFILGIQAMEYIVKEIPKIEMKIITKIFDIENLQNIIDNLSLKKNIDFHGYTPIPEKYFRNISLNIITSISESFCLVLSETKLYGIPNILIGIDYITIGNKGTVIIYDDSPESLAKESIKILRNEEYKNRLGREGRRSMRLFKNEELLNKWIKLILSVYCGNYFYEKLRKLDKKITEKKITNLLKNQISLLKNRNSNLKDIILNDIENLSFLLNVK